jgi:hypothetical protein
MKYICLGYYDPAKHAGMTEDERTSCSTNASSTTTICARTGTLLQEKLFSLVRRH